MAYNDADQGVALIVVCWVFLASSSVIVALRFWVRITRVHRISIDDLLILFSLFFEYIHSIFICIGYTYGLGRHISTLSDYNRIQAIKWIVIIQFFAVITTMFGRISFSTFLLQIVGPTDRWQKAFLWGVIVLQLVVTIPTLVQIYTQCGVNVAALWDPKVAAYATCQSPNVQTVIGYVQSGLNSLCDLILSVLPCFVLWHLHMPLGTKIGLGAVLTLSIFALGASIAKAVEIRNLGQRSDFTWAFVNLSIWVAIENNVVIIAASIPTLRPIMKRSNGTTGNSSSAQRNWSGPSNKVFGSSGHGTTAKASKIIEQDTRAGWLSSKLHGKPEHSAQSTSIAGTGLGNGSEEYILRTLGDQTITKTTDVRVAYESHGSGHGSLNSDHSQERV